jgi:hypothetical protein
MNRTWGTVVWLLVIAVAAAVAFRFAPPARAQVGQGVVLSEILAGPARDWDGDGAFDARKDEWIEVWNSGAGSVDLSGYRLADADSTIRYELSGFLDAGAVAWIAGSMAEDQQRAAGRTVTGLSLNNAGDTIFLFRVQGSDTSAVDSRKYGSIEGASDRSVGRMGDAGTWVLFDGLNRYTGTGEPKGTGCEPTPRARNDCPTDAVGTTWGKIKALYR